MLDIRKLLDDHEIPYKEEGADWQPGWINIKCPMPNCTDPMFHGGFNLSAYYSCWRCGFHNIDKVLQNLLSLSHREVKTLIRQYTDPLFIVTDQKKAKSQAKSIDWPDNCHALQGKHKKYLKKRNFDPEKLEEQWKLKGTGPIGAYKFRIIAPIDLDGKMISYQGRDVTGKQTLRYKACPIDLEIKHHKHTLYGIDHVKDSCIIVEGITDVWRLGYGSIATFGVEFSMEQALMISKKVKFAAILFDQEAEEMACSLSSTLEGLGIESEVWILETVSDPAELTDIEARNIMKLIRR